MSAVVNTTDRRWCRDCSGPLRLQLPSQLVDLALELGEVGHDVKLLLLCLVLVCFTSGVSTAADLWHRWDRCGGRC